MGVCLQLRPATEAFLAITAVSGTLSHALYTRMWPASLSMHFKGCALLRQEEQRHGAHPSHVVLENRQVLQDVVLHRAHVRCAHLRQRASSQYLGLGALAHASACMPSHVRRQLCSVALLAHPHALGCAPHAVTLLGSQSAPFWVFSALSDAWVQRRSGSRTQYLVVLRTKPCAESSFLMPLASPRSWL